jgi:hypothetical protein
MASVWDQYAKPKQTSVWDQYKTQPTAEPDYYGIPETPPPTPSRGLWAINDYVIEAANAVLGGVKALSDVAVPGSEFAKQVEALIQQGAESQSQVAQQAKQQLSQDIEAGGLQALKGVGSYVLENPLLATSQAVGSFALPGTAIKGAQAAARGLGVGERAVGRALQAGPITPEMAAVAGQQAVGRVGLGAGALTGAALGGGDAAGQAYDIVMQETGNEALALQAARDASIAPAAIGGLTGLIGAERLFAGLGKAGRGGRIKTAATTGLSEAAQETFEEGATQLSANLAAQQFVPELDVMKGVVGSAALGFALGGITGVGIGGLTGGAGQPEDFIKAGINLRQDQTFERLAREQQLRERPLKGLIRPGAELSTQDLINQITGVTRPEGERPTRQSMEAALNEPTGQMVAGPGGIERPQTAGDVYGVPSAPARAAQPAAQQTQGAKPPQAQAPQIDPAVAQQVAQTYGVSQVPAGPGVPTQAFTIAGKTVIGVPRVNQIVSEIAQANQNKDPERVQLESAIVASGIPISGQPSAKGILSGIDSVIKKYQLDGAATLNDAANILEFQISQGKSPKSVEPLARIYEALTGQMSPAFQRLTEGPTTETTPLKFGLASSIVETPKVGFKTEKGSVYSLDEQNKTSRTKVSEGKGKGTTYEPHSALYVDPKDAQSILEDMQGGALDRSTSIRHGYIDTKDNTFVTLTDLSKLPAGVEPLVAVIDTKQNKVVGIYKAKANPEVGLSPIEKLYTEDGMSSTHVGNKIVELFGQTESTTTPSSTPATTTTPAAGTLGLMTGQPAPTAQRDYAEQVFAQYDALPNEQRAEVARRLGLTLPQFIETEAVFNRTEEVDDAIAAVKRTGAPSGLQSTARTGQGPQTAVGRTTGITTTGTPATGAVASTPTTGASQTGRTSPAATRPEEDVDVASRIFDGIAQRFEINIKFTDLDPSLQEAWFNAVEANAANREVVTALANEQTLDNNSKLADEILQIAINRMYPADKQKVKREFVLEMYGTTQENRDETVEQLAKRFNRSIDTIKKDWNRTVKALMGADRQKFENGIKAAMVELRLSDEQSTEYLNNLIETLRTQQDQAQITEAEVQELRIDERELGAEDASIIAKGRTSDSIQEKNNAVETNNQAYARVIEALDAIEVGNKPTAKQLAAANKALADENNDLTKLTPLQLSTLAIDANLNDDQFFNDQIVTELNNRLENRIETAKKLSEANIRRRTSEPTQEGDDAVPKRETEKVSVQPKARVGEKVGQKVRVAKEPAAEGETQTQKEEVKTTAVADVSKFGRLQEYLNRFKPLSTQNFQMVGSGQLTAIRKNSEFKTLENVTDGEIQAKYEVRDLPNSETKRHTLVLMGRGRNNEVFQMDFDLGTTSSEPHSLKQRRSVDGDTLMVHYPGDLESGNLIFNIFGSPRAIEARKSTQVTTTGTTKAPSTQTTQAAAVLTVQEAAEAKYNELRQLVGDALPTWDKLSDAQRAALVEIDPAQMNLRDLQRIVDDSRTIDVEAREVSGTERQLLLEQTNKLNDSQVKLLENEYGAKVGTDSFVKQLSTDVSNYVNKGAEFVSAKIRAVIKAIASGVLAVGIVFNPNIQLSNFAFDLPTVYASSKTVITEVPADAAPRMSALAQSVYVQMANAAQKSGKGFIIADKPNGMIHLFNADGSLLAQDTALYGKDVGDSIAGQKASLEGGPKVTPAGQFELGIMPSNDYAGGFGLTLQGTDQPLTSPENLAKKRFNSTVAVHAAYLGDVNERRLDRLASKSAKDNRISYGCINTSHDLFINKIKPNAKSFDGGMIFVLPDNPQFLAEKGQLPTPPTQVAGTTRFSISPSDDKTRGQFMAATQRIDDLTGRVKNRQEDADVARTNADRYANKYGKNEFWQGLDEQAKIYEREVQEAKAELRKAKDEFTTRFSKRPGAKGSNAATLRKSVVDFIGADNQRKLVVVQTVKDIDDTVVAEIEKETGPIVDGTQGFVHKGKAYLIASNIEPGTERAVFMHEVGSHLGLENILSEQQFDTLVDKILEWSQKTDNSLESQLAVKALVRVASADPMDAARNTELVAYFIEEAIIAGVDPTAVKTQVGFGDWFRTLWSAFKRAIRKLGFNPEKMDAFDIVNMAYGAARMEIAGTWHGTSAKFRKFDHRFMGTGEGAQAYGWGTYLAQRAGIAYQYLIKDIKKKAGAPKKGLQQFENEEEAKQYFDTLARELGTAPGTVYSPITQEVFLEKGDILSGDVLQFIFEMGVNGWIIGPKPNNPTEVITSLIWTKTVDKETGEILKFPKLRSIKGNLLRIDVNAQDNELLNWDIALKDQKEVYDKLNKNLSDYAKEQLNLALDSQLGTFTGSDLYQALKNVVFKTQRAAYGSLLESEFKTRLRDLVGSDNISARSDELVSKYLDSIGIKGIRFLDSASREPTRSVLLNKINSYERVIKDLQSYGTAQIASLAKKNIDYKKVAIIAIQQYQKIVNNAKKELETALPDSELTRNLVIFNEKNIFRVLAKEVEFDNLQNKPNIVGQKTKFSIAPAQEMAAEQALNVFKSRRANSSTNVSGVPSTVRTAADTIYQTLRNWTRKGVDRVVFTEALINRAVESGIWSAAEFKQLMQARGVETRKFEKEVERIADMYALVPDKDRGTGSQSVNAFIYDSTRTKKWGFQPKWRSTGVAVDGDLEIRFNALSSEAQSFIRAVFKHGDDTLALKKKILMDYTNSEYDAQIKAAQADGNAELIAELQKEKIADLKKFDTLFKLREGIPYAPLKRIGKYAVVAKSPEYRAAEDVDDKKRIRELEQDPNHHQVTFVDSNIQAINLQKQLQDQGFYGTSEDAVYYFERKSPDDKLYASDTIAVLSRLRAKVDSSIDQDSKTTNQLRKIITDMYLHTLADASARKSELRRRNVPGEIDMLQSFALQGRADANFLAAIQYNDRTQKTIKKMEREAQRSGNRARKSELFNELNARYIQSLEYEPNQMVQKLNRLTSVYFLASSPGYYLQNFTQPWMMSLPVMAGRHDYTKSANALYNAYFDLKDVMKSAKLFDQQFDFSKVPDDIKDVVETLVNRSQIDIGISTEMGEFTIEGQGPVSNTYNKVDKGLRLAVQKVEAINRLTTAIAAYRLELAKTGNRDLAVDYASSIINDTHGDYSAFNAPRMFNTNVGKVALQFRKFQLIQLGLLAKLIKNSFEKGPEQQVARKALGYILAQTAVLTGVMGMPGAAAIAWALEGLLGDEDEPYDIKGQIRDAIGNNDIANIVLYGSPNLAGVNLSGKIGMGNALSVMPFTEIKDLNGEKTYQIIGTLLGGPAGGMAARMADGMSYIAAGDEYKGLELMLPKGVGDAMRSVRVYNEGFTSRRGDVLLPPDQIGEVTAFWQFLGLTPTQTSVRGEQQGRTIDIEQKFSSRSSTLKRQYEQAAKDQDRTKQAELRRQWLDLQAARVRNGYPRKPMSELTRAPQEQRKRERQTSEGVPFTDSSRRFVERITE